MPKTKFQEFIFTLITSGCMIFIMGVYNVAIHTGGLQAATFKPALHILVVGPFCRFIFHHLFAFTNQGNESKVENEMEQQGFAE